MALPRSSIWRKGEREGYGIFEGAFACGEPNVHHSIGALMLDLLLFKELLLKDSNKKEIFVL